MSHPWFFSKKLPFSEFFMLARNFQSTINFLVTIDLYMNIGSSISKKKVNILFSVIMLLHHQRQDNMDFAIGTWLFICYATLILPRLLGRPWAMQPATLHTLLNKFGQGQQKRGRPRLSCFWLRAQIPRIY